MKSKKLKILGIIAAVLLVIVIVVGVFVIRNLNGIVRLATEKTLQYVLLVDSTVADADVRPLRGYIALKGIDIPNPEDFATDHAMKFGHIAVDADLKSFTTDTGVVREIRLEGADIILEKTLKSSNLQELIKNTEHLTASEDGEAPPPEDEAAPESEAGKKVIIEKIIVAETTVRVAMPMTGGKTVNVIIPEIEINNLGGEGKVITIADATRILIETILWSVVDVGANTIPELGEMKEQLAALGVAAKQRAGQAVNLATDTAGQAVNLATDTASSTVDGTTTLVKDTGAKSKEILGDTTKSIGEKSDALTDTASGAVSGATEAVTGATESVTESAKGLGDKIGGLFSKDKEETPNE